MYMEAVDVSANFSFIKTNGQQGRQIASYLFMTFDILLIRSITDFPLASPKKDTQADNIGR